MGRMRPHKSLCAACSYRQFPLAGILQCMDALNGCSLDGAGCHARQRPCSPAHWQSGLWQVVVCKIILPPELRAYYNDRIDFRNDNTLMRGLSSFALINIDEFDRYSASRQPLIKYIISKSEVTAVKAYRSNFSTERRYASFIATTNSRHPLTDLTGSRRFACVELRATLISLRLLIISSFMPRL